MSDFLQLVFSGLALGAVYGLVALGFVAIFSVREIVNLVQGEYAALAGLSAIGAVTAGVPLLLAFVLVVPSVVLVSVVIERLAIRPVHRMTPTGLHHPDPGDLDGSQGRDAAGLGPGGPPAPEFGRDLVVGGVSIQAQEPWILGTAAVVRCRRVVLRAHRGRQGAAGVCRTAHRRTARGHLAPHRDDGGVRHRGTGRSSRRGGQQPDLPQLVEPRPHPRPQGVRGGDPRRGSCPSGRDARGLFLGVLESPVAGYGATGFRDAVAFVVLLLVLLVRPQGLALKASGVRV